MSESNQGMSGAIASLGSHLWEALSLRGKLAASELKLAQARFLWLVAWSAIALITILMADLFACLGLVFVFWDTSPLATMLAIAGGHLLLALVAGWQIRVKLDQVTHPLRQTARVVKEDTSLVWSQS